MTTKEKKIIGSILAFLVSALVWGITEWCDYNVFKAATIDDLRDLKSIAKETNETLKRVEIEVAKIGIKIEKK
jgi:hypothetical protein